MGDEKTTTISLHIQTKKLLLRVGGDYAVEDGKTYSYNDTIIRLIKEHNERKKRGEIP